MLKELTTPSIAIYNIFLGRTIEKILQEKDKEDSD